MKYGIEKERVCFWLPIPIHNYLKDMSNDGKVLFGKKYGMGDVVTDFCCKAEPGLLKVVKPNLEVQSVP